MSAEHAPDDVRSWLGDSIGRWEGDTLVVETTNFNDSPSLSGASRDLRVTEWFTRLDGQTLRYRFRVEDPSVWTAPWSGEYVWPATGNRLYEYACHEANYSFGGILRGARILEKELLGKKGGRLDSNRSGTAGGIGLAAGRRQRVVWPESVNANQSG